MLSQVDHLNLVKLIGYLEAEHEHILVMEYVPNGNLREHLDGNYGVALDMSTRLDIAIDVAHALTYLHLYADKPIIHRDVKSSNILLTGKFRAKVADFGFSHVGPTDVGMTHVSTQVKGTLGYLDPEYLTTNQLTTKSDVYSFGILLVEIFTGRNPIELKRPGDERVTFRWVSTQFILCLVYLLDSFINVVGKVGITSGLNRKRRILIQHQIKLATFCIWLAQVDLFMRVLSCKLICVCSTKEIDLRLDCFVGIQEFCGGESD
jgi:serine/threonine protein kinase